MNQKIICDLDLGARGLRIVERPISNFLPLDDRSFLKVGGGQTKREVAKFSARDADRLDDYQTRLAAAADILRSSGPCHVHGGLAVPRYSGYRFPPEIIQQAIFGGTQLFVRPQTAQVLNRLPMRQRADEVTGWWLDSPIKAEIDRILRETITDPKIVVITGFSLV